MANVIEVESDGEEGDMRDIATTVAGATVAAPAVGYLPLYPGHVPLWPPLMPGAAASLDQARGSAIPRPVPRPHLSADANAFAAGHQRVPPPPDGSFDFARMDTNGQSAGVGGLEVVVEEDFHDVTETPLVVRPMAGRLEPIGVCGARCSPTTAANGKEIDMCECPLCHITLPADKLSPHLKGTRGATHCEFVKQVLLHGLSVNVARAASATTSSGRSDRFGIHDACGLLYMAPQGVR